MTNSLWLARAAAVCTTLVAAVVDVVASDAFQSDPIQFSMWFVVPVGAFAIGALALSGYVLACQRAGVATHRLDLPFLMALALALPLMIVGIRYLGLLPVHGAMPRPLIPFGEYVARTITESTLTVSDARFCTASGRVGEFGWFILVPKLAALLAIAKVAHVMSGDARRAGASAWER